MDYFYEEITWLDHHKTSELLASDAQASYIKGNYRKARELYGKAADEEWAATSLVPQKLERTLSALYVSTASLFIKAGWIKEAIFVAKDGLKKRGYYHPKKDLLPWAKLALKEILDGKSFK